MARVKTEKTRPDFETLRRRFRAHGQDHVFAFWEQHSQSEREALLAQAARIDLSLLERLFRDHCAAVRVSPKLEPLEIQRVPEHGGDAEAFRAARERGEDLLARGRLAVLVAAGGQGSRLGFDGPKGAFPLGPVTGRTLFELQAQKLRALGRRYGHSVPWYIMTSPSTDAATRQIFASHDSFGLSPVDVFFFSQQTFPAVDFEGRLMLQSPARIFESPNGHGGCLTALLDSGAARDMRSRGCETIFYYQVDNPLVKIGDPTYLGFHATAEAEMSCKITAKRDPQDKMGVVARVDGHPSIVEYTELSDSHRYARNADGELLYWAGNLAVHVLELSFVERVAARADEVLSYHASAKRIPCIGVDGKPHSPAEANGYKFERFIFDALSAARSIAVVETLREEEYSPVKNSDDANRECPATARRDLSCMYRRWLFESQISVPGDEGIWIEIDHSFADGAEDLKSRGIHNISEAAGAIRITHGSPIR